MEESLLSHKLARTFPLSKKPAVAVFHRLSRERHAQGAYWKYVVVKPKPFCYALRAVERTKRGWTISFAQSRPFTGDYRIAKSASGLSMVPGGYRKKLIFVGKYYKCTLNVC